jgi:hypothetical protein
MKKYPGLVCILALVVTITSCKKVTYYYYGQLDTISSYLAKDSVEKVITDNTGRTVWLVTRYLSDTLGTAWVTNETYSVTPTAQTLEVAENNLRFVKLAFPMDEGFSWPGNNYLPYDPYQDFFLYSATDNLNLGSWNYTYQNVNKPYTLPGKAYDSTITVLQISDSSSVPIIPIDSSFASMTYWTETYAQHIGLIYRQTQMWEYQPPTRNSSQAAYYIGFKLTMRLVDHN